MNTFSIKTSLYLTLSLFLTIILATSLAHLYRTHQSAERVALFGHVTFPTQSLLQEHYDMTEYIAMTHGASMYYDQVTVESVQLYRMEMDSSFSYIKQKTIILNHKWDSIGNTESPLTSIIDKITTLEKAYGMLYEMAASESSNGMLTNSQKLTDFTNKTLVPLTTEYREYVKAQLDQIQQHNNNFVVEQQKISDNAKLASAASIFIGILASVLLTYWLYQSIYIPLNAVVDRVHRLTKGDVPEKGLEISAETKVDEIINIQKSFAQLEESVRKSSSFAASIGKGQYDHQFQPLSDKDILGNSLLEMRNSLEMVNKEAKQRSWATTGLAEFGETLRQNNQDLAKLCEKTLAKAVKYLNANQGALFVINDSETEPYLELASCYAWKRKKYLSKKIMQGEGLAGQAWIERSKIFMTDIPDDYVNITSGLGKALPSCLLVMPLIVNETVYGVLEIASFKVFEQYEVEFVEKLSENIASTLSSVKTTEKTQMLLEESTQMTEQLRAQEEEMRQNMEEMIATQEELERQRQLNA
ncbi:hypothetical protein FUAX_10420 [Fulvitalea axinellae]|uniref:GAF domain-containing protein n=1 Tax=Fulvitalea axinellae TaxID=1182444 RepID=A0AAU9D8L8_9BACT|nr:hypothetical protein FUAX_10420 [Fulvitalea axinellae]